MALSFTLRQKEIAIVKACLDSDRQAQKQLYDTYFPKMMSIALRYAKNEQDARDILQDGFIKVFKNIHKFQLGTSLYSWIRTIMVNTSIDHYRKKSYRRTEDIDEAQGITSVSADVISNMSADDIISCMQGLSLSYRTVFNMYVIEGYSHKEIGQTLGITESTSRSNLVKARKKLKKLIQLKFQDKSI